MYICPYIFSFSLIIQYIIFNTYILDVHVKHNVLYYYMFFFMNINALSTTMILFDYVNAFIVYNANMLLLMILSSMIKYMMNYIVSNKIYYIFIPGSMCNGKYPHRHVI